MSNLCVSLSALLSFAMSSALSTIIEHFGQCYFGVLGTTFTAWTDLENMIKRYCEESGDVLEKCLLAMLKHIGEEHPSSVFPVPQHYKIEVKEWIEALCRKENAWMQAINWAGYT